VWLFRPRRRSLLDWVGTPVAQLWPEVCDMRKAAFVMIGALLVAGTVWAQGTGNTKERPSKADIQIDEPLRVGSVTLPAGNYRIVCDHKHITFTKSADGKKFEFDCKGRQMDKESDVTVTGTALDKNGVRYLAKLLLRGSRTEHIFE
jgi:hypothetical protein